MPPSTPPSKPQSSIYLTIMFIMVVNVVLGAALALAADLVWQDEALKLFGVGLAVVAGLGYLLFRLLGRAELRRRMEEARGEENRRGDGGPRDEG